jgi:hypothetical protein
LPPGQGINKWSGINDFVQVKQFINCGSTKQGLQRVSCVRVGVKADETQGAEVI